jgi:Zn-finger nucleic acid-binding protein
MSTTSTRTCPTCNEPLDVVAHEGVDLDRCPAGHGVWLDKGELRAVVLSEVADRPQEEELVALDAAARDHGQGLLAEVARGTRSCPVCAGPMQITEYAGSGVAIDECRLHGVWLDDGELERIEAYAEGIRNQARGGAAGTAARTTVAGLDIPADLLATIRTANVPPPR